MGCKWLGAALFALAACESPELLPPLPIVEGATSVVWAAVDASGGQIRVLRDPGAPLGSTIALGEGSFLELHYFGCDGSALGFDDDKLPTCLPTTAERHRWRPGLAAFEPIGGASSLVAECGVRRCERVIPKEVETIIAADSGIDEQTSTAALVPIAGQPPGVLISTIDVQNGSRLILFELGRDPVVLGTFGRGDHVSGLFWAHGEIWSVGFGGFRRGTIEGDTVVWSQALAAVTATTGIGTSRVRMDVVSEDPFELLVVTSNGLVARWSNERVLAVQAGRSEVAQEIRGGRSDLAPWMNSWILLGPAEPVLGPSGRWDTRAWVEYRDGVLSAEVPLEDVAAVEHHPELGTALVTQNGGFYRPTPEGPRFYFEVAGAAARRLAAFQDRFVVVRSSGSMTYARPDADPCTTPAALINNSVDVMVDGDWLIEVGERLQVRWLKAGPECELK